MYKNNTPCGKVWKTVATLFHAGNDFLDCVVFLLYYSLTCTAGANGCSSDFRGASAKHDQRARSVLFFPLPLPSPRVSMRARRSLVVLLSTPKPGAYHIEQTFHRTGTVTGKLLSMVNNQRSDIFTGNIIRINSDYGNSINIRRWNNLCTRSQDFERSILFDSR